jgi:hypothetical protein
MVSGQHHDGKQLEVPDDLEHAPPFPYHDEEPATIPSARDNLDSITALAPTELEQSADSVESSSLTSPDGYHTPAESAHVRYAPDIAEPC